MNKKVIRLGEPVVRPDLIVWATSTDSTDEFVVTDDRTGFCYKIPSQTLIKSIHHSDYPDYWSFTSPEPANVRALNMILRDCSAQITIFLCSSAKKLLKKICN